jgi:gas vesicle protein
MIFRRRKADPPPPDPALEPEVEVVTVPVYVPVRPATKRGNDAYLLLGLVSGAVLGAAGALFLTPQTGADLRKGKLGSDAIAARDPEAEAAEALRQMAASQPAEALDPLAQVAQYGDTPVRTDASPPYTVAADDATTTP